MAEVEINGVHYTTTRLNAFNQWHIARKLMPFLPALMPVARVWLARMERGATIAPEEQDQALVPIANALAAMSYADSNFIMNICLDAVRRRDEQGRLHQVRVAGPPEQPGQLMYELDLGTLIRLTVEVCRADVIPSLGDLLPGFLGTPTTEEVAQTGNGAAQPTMALSDSPTS